MPRVLKELLIPMLDHISICSIFDQGHLFTWQWMRVCLFFGTPPSISLVLCVANPMAFGVQVTSDLADLDEAKYDAGLSSPRKVGCVGAAIFGFEQ